MPLGRLSLNTIQTKLNKLKELVDGNEYYKNMEEDAFDVVAHYTNAVEPRA